MDPRSIYTLLYRVLQNKLTGHLGNAKMSRKNSIDNCGQSFAFRDTGCLSFKVKTTDI